MKLFSKLKQIKIECIMGLFLSVPWRPWANHLASRFSLLMTAQARFPPIALVVLPTLTVSLH